MTSEDYASEQWELERCWSKEICEAFSTPNFWPAIFIKAIFLIISFTVGLLKTYFKKNPLKQQDLVEITMYLKSVLILKEANKIIFSWMSEVLRSSVQNRLLR